jgi:hypothetical protein
VFEHISEYYSHKAVTKTKNKTEIESENDSESDDEKNGKGERRIDTDMFGSFLPQYPYWNRTLLFSLIHTKAVNIEDYDPLTEQDLIARIMHIKKRFPEYFNSHRQHIFLYLNLIQNRSFKLLKRILIPTSFLLNSTSSSIYTWKDWKRKK